MSLQDMSGMNHKKLSGIPNLSGNQAIGEFGPSAEDEALKGMDKTNPQEALAELMSACQRFQRLEGEESRAYQKTIVLAALRLYRVIEDQGEESFAG